MYDMLVHVFYNYKRYKVYIWVRISTVVKIIKINGTIRGMKKTPEGFSDMTVNIFYFDYQKYKWFMGGILTSFKIISQSLTKMGEGVENDPVTLI